MNASYKPSIASEVHARHKRPHRLALLATSPVATGEAKIGEPHKGTETCQINAPQQGSRHDLRHRTPQGDGAYLQPPMPERWKGKLRQRIP